MMTKDVATGTLLGRQYADMIATHTHDDDFMEWTAPELIHDKRLTQYGRVLVKRALEDADVRRHRLNVRQTRNNSLSVRLAVDNAPA